MQNTVLLATGGNILCCVAASASEPIFDLGSTRRTGTDWPYAKTQRRKGLRLSLTPSKTRRGRRVPMLISVWIVHVCDDFLEGEAPAEP